MRIDNNMIPATTKANQVNHPLHLFDLSPPQPFGRHTLQTCPRLRLDTIWLLLFFVFEVMEPIATMAYSKTDIYNDMRIFYALHVTLVAGFTSLSGISLGSLSWLAIFSSRA